VCIALNLVVLQHSTRPYWNIYHCMWCFVSPCHTKNYHDSHVESQLLTCCKCYRHDIKKLLALDTVSSA
jgi:hypothetical protein